MTTPPATATPPVDEVPPVKDGILATTFRAFHYRAFRLMWTGAFTSTTGTFVQEVAQSWLVYTLTNSPRLLGLIGFLNGIPLIFSLLGGVAADRIDRRKLLMLSQFIQMGSALALSGLIWFDLIEIWHIMAAAAVTGIAQAIGGPAWQALIPTLVDKKQDLPNGIALMSIQFNLARVVGPLVGGHAFGILGAAACFGANGVSFLAVILALMVVQVRFVPQKTDVHVLDSLKEGLVYVFRDHAIFAMILLSMITAFFGVPLMTLMPVFAGEVFGLDAKGYGSLMAFWAAGGVTAALFVAAKGNAPHKGRLALIMLLFLGLTTIGFAASKTYWIGAFFLFMSGGAILASFALINSLVQLLAPEEMRGRILSVYTTAFRGAMPVGMLAAGWVADRIDAPTVITANGVILVAFAIWYLLHEKQVRHL